MTQQVKNTVSNWIEDFDNAHDYNKLTKEQKKERMINIKAIILFCNEFEKYNLWHKFKTVYPMSHPSQTIRTIPINFKK